MSLDKRDSVFYAILLCAALAFTYGYYDAEVDDVAAREVIEKQAVSEAFGIAIERAKQLEGFSSTPYFLMGHWHIGYGTTISGPETLTEVSLAQATALLYNDMQTVESGIRASYPVYDELPLQAQTVLLDMGYNLGVQGLMGFENMLSAMEGGHWLLAIEEISDSVYMLQVPNRAESNIYQLLEIVDEQVQ